MADDRSDEVLLEAARTGDRGALDALIERHAPRVFRFGMKLCHDEEDAREVLQDTLLTAARSVRSFRGASSLSTWLYTIARSYCIKRRRKGVHAPVEMSSLGGHDDEADLVADPARLPDDELAGREIQSVLEDAIRALDPKYREVLLLRDMEGVPGPLVGVVLGIGVDAVNSGLHRAGVAIGARVAPALGMPGAAPPAPACPDVVRMLSEHLEGDIGPEICRRMEEHVAGCPACADRCNSLREVLAMCRASDAPALPPEVAASVRRAIREVVGSAPTS